MKVIQDPQVHIMESTGDAYDWVNVGCHFPDGCPEEGCPINNGDVLVVPSEGVIGIAVSAWPTAVVYDDPGAFHTCDNFDALMQNMDTDYGESLKKVEEVRQSDADITGNRQWTS